MSLFEKTRIKNMSLKNRFFKSASWEGLASESGHMTEELFKIYEELARGGVGTIITGYAYVTRDEKPSPGMMGIYEDSFIKEYKELTEMVHDNDTNIIAQLVYGGSMSGLVPPSKEIFGPSAVENERTEIVPKEMTKDDMDFLIKSFTDASSRAKQAGFDGVELHGAHGYLLSQFLCPHYNRRRDEYGGSIENRARIIIEIVKSVKAAVGEDYPILIKLNSEDFMEDGLTSQDSVVVSKMLEKSGIDAIEVSGGNGSSIHVMENNLSPSRARITFSKDRESYFADHAIRLSKEIDIPVILTGGNRDLEFMENLLETSDISYFAFARPLISEPDLINRWKSGDTEKPKCIYCNKCFETYGARCIFNQK